MNEQKNTQEDHDMLIRHDERIRALETFKAWLMRSVVGGILMFVAFEVLKDVFK